MELIPIIVVKLLGLSINYAHFFKLIPFNWNKEKQCLSLNKIRWRSFGIILTILHQIFITVRLFQSLFAFEQNLPYYCAQMVYYMGHSVSLIFLVPITFQAEDWVLIINQFLCLCKDIQVRHVKESAPTPFYHKELICLIVILQVFSYIGPFLTMIFLYENPKGPLFINSILPKGEDPWNLMVWCVPLNLLVNLMLWAVVCMMGSIFAPWIYVTIFIVKELRCEDASKWTKANFREPLVIIKTYRCLYMLTNQINDIGRIILMLLNDLAIVMFVLISFVLIKFHDKFYSSMFFFTLIFISGTYIILAYIKLGGINALSIKLIKSLKVYRTKYPKFTRILITKYMKSFNTLKVYMGSFGYFKKPFTLRILGKLLTYTVKFLLMTKNFM